tara:strand:+ start:582 stop:845 length:264 start_codon:yes stop_codon:yes gene_type:complete
MGTVTLTLEEYNDLVSRAHGMDVTRRAAVDPRPLGTKKKRGKAARGMAAAMREANERLRTKSGKLRKGKTQADVARLAHKIRRQKYA